MEIYKIDNQQDIEIVREYLKLSIKSLTSIKNLIAMILDDVLSLHCINLTMRGFSVDYYNYRDEEFRIGLQDEIKLYRQIMDKIDEELKTRKNEIRTVREDVQNLNERPGNREVKLILIQDFTKSYDKIHSLITTLQQNFVYLQINKINEIESDLKNIISRGMEKLSSLYRIMSTNVNRGYSLLRKINFHNQIFADKVAILHQRIGESMPEIKDPIMDYYGPTSVKKIQIKPAFIKDLKQDTIEIQYIRPGSKLIKTVYDIYGNPVKYANQPFNENEIKSLQKCNVKNLYFKDLSLKKEIDPRYYTIMVVEDDPYSRELLFDFLTDIGFNYHYAEDGEQALRMINEVKPDLILLDIMLPKINGFDFLQKIRKTKYHENTPVIVISAANQKEYVRKAAEFGAVSFIVKPYKIDVLELRIKKYLNLPLPGSEPVPPANFHPIPLESIFIVQLDGYIDQINWWELTAYINNQFLPLKSQFSVIVFNLSLVFEESLDIITLERILMTLESMQLDKGTSILFITNNNRMKKRIIEYNFQEKFKGHQTEVVDSIIYAYHIMASLN